MRASLAKFCWRAGLAIASPLAGACFTLRLFEATPQDPVGAAWIAAAIFAFSLILGIGFSIDALETRERPRWLAIMTLLANGAAAVGCLVVATFA